MTSGPAVRLVMPHQLFEAHLDADGGTVFVLVEHDLLLRQYSFHSHKLVLHRATLSRFAGRLRERGFEVVVLQSEVAQSSRDQLAAVIRGRKPSQVTWFDVVDDWLEKDLFAALADGGYQMHQDDVLETPNFFSSRNDIDDWFSHNDARMQDFYAWQRRRFDILMENGKPVGGKWSFDTENRKKLPRGYTPATVGRFAQHPFLQREGTFDIDALMAEADEATANTSTDATADASDDVALAIKWVSAQFPNAPGDPRLFSWPTTHNEARA
ncbi:MAG TPA: cryptochrome/photolyase family protein, partial [Glaciihabitans sp.]|nr:cryptochrome/photolyase family protein [Glaciihabitans sp.]